MIRLTGLFRTAEGNLEGPTGPNVGYVIERASKEKSGSCWAGDATLFFQQKSGRKVERVEISVLSYEDVNGERVLQGRESAAVYEVRRVPKTKKEKSPEFALFVRRDPDGESGETKEATVDSFFG